MQKQSPPGRYSTLCSPLLLASPWEREKALEMDLSYRSTISIYKVSADTRDCSCLPRGDVGVGGEELLSAKGSLEGWVDSRGLDPSPG